MTETPLAARRAFEALRAGVPNRDAVLALGFDADGLLRTFDERLSEVSASIDAETHPKGLLIAAEFGGGKSHAIEFLSHKALDANFAVSKVIISKETQLFDLHRVFSASVDSLRVRNRIGTGLDEIAFSQLSSSNPPFSDLESWLGKSGLNACFEATLYLFREARANRELQQRLVQFWSGGPLQITPLKKDLRSCGAAGIYPLERITTKDLARERFKFMSGMLYAAGYSGWLIFLDELELVGRYSFLQRGRSYAELCRLLGLHDEFAIPGLLTVGAITPDFDSAVLRDKDDLNQIGFRFRARGDAENELIAALAERAMMEIGRHCIRLPEPERASLTTVMNRLAEVYKTAYGVSPSRPELGGLNVGWQMREHIRSWITRWDLQRIEPTYVSQTEVERIQTDYAENTLLEQSTQDDEAAE
ncbi:MAG: hypothetical protein EXS64_07845 [Candidatus Latescibacteria bacterium]|nr:hypothetical protein [Candidatus Latescibacterota bacterium]